MADASTGGGASKSAVKNAKTDAGKAAKKHPDPAGLALIEKADAALAAKDLDTALALFKEAEAVCKASTVEAAAKEKKPKAPPPADAGGAKAADSAAAEAEGKKPRLYLSMPTENLQAKSRAKSSGAMVDDAHNYAANTEAALKAHLAATGGKFRTRFPPEPNGYLHIGHAKAMNFNFGQARLGQEVAPGGETVMRFDDTNPTAEKMEFIDSILDNVAWLGHTPAQITYSSDYFQELYDLAVQLIKDGGAFVCHQTGAEIKASRALLREYHGRGLPPEKKGPLPKGAASPYRARSPEENLHEFNKMRQGRYAEGAAVLRLKGDLHSENTAMWDLAAYRIMYHAHPKTGDAWCIYPTYDYTHCIVDSLENITHSLCTLEFENRQAADGPYYHLLHGLKLYKPVTWEYSRLNLTHAVMSKRKLKFLVTYDYVDGWDDPRLCTLNGLRRRGFTGNVVNAFCQEIGVTRSAMTAKMALLEQLARRELDATAERRFAVLKPLKVVLTDLPKGGKPFEMSNHPKDASLGVRPLKLSSTIYIEREDFRPDLADDPNFYGLAVGREVGLLGASVNITVTEAVLDPKSGEVSHLVATVDVEKKNKPKGHLHWVSADTAVAAECRVYDVLFSPEDPEKAAKEAAAAGGDAPPAEEAEEEDDDEDAAKELPTELPPWLKLLNPKSLVTEQALVEPSLAKAACAPDRTQNRPAFQFQRVGFFCVDDTSTSAKPVFNRIVSLREDKEKKALT